MTGGRSFCQPKVDKPVLSTLLRKEVSMILDTIVEDKKIRLREEKDIIPVSLMRDKG